MSRVTTRPEPVQGHDDDTPTADSLPGAGEVESSADPDGEQLQLTVAAVARRLGVAPATLRTWDRRYGLGPSGHTSGRHRRYGPDDIARLEQMQRALLRGASPAEAARYARSASPALPQHYPANAEQAERPVSHEPLLVSGVLEDPDDNVVESASNAGGRGLKLSGAGPRARGVGRAVLSLDSWSAQRLLIEAMQAEGVVSTWRDVLRPVLRAITERRQRTGSGIEMLQLLVDCASTALRAVIANAQPPLNPRPVVLASAPGEAQGLELVALAAALATNRVGHRLFGPALPQEGLNTAVRRSAPAAVVLWAEHSHYASAQLFADLPAPRQRLRAFAAGAGWSAEPLPIQVEQLDSLERAVARISETLLG